MGWSRRRTGPPPPPPKGAGAPHERRQVPPPKCRNRRGIPTRRPDMHHRGRRTPLRSAAAVRLPCPLPANMPLLPPAAAVPSCESIPVPAPRNSRVPKSPARSPDSSPKCRCPPPRGNSPRGPDGSFPVPPSTSSPTRGCPANCTRGVPIPSPTRRPVLTHPALPTVPAACRPPFCTIHSGKRRRRFPVFP